MTKDMHSHLANLFLRVLMPLSVSVELQYSASSRYIKFKWYTSSVIKILYLSSVWYKTRLSSFICDRKQLLDETIKQCTFSIVFQLFQFRHLRRFFFFFGLFYVENLIRYCSQTISIFLFLSTLTKTISSVDFKISSISFTQMLVLI